MKVTVTGDLPCPTEPATSSNYIQYSTIGDNKFTVPSFTSIAPYGTLTYSLAGTNATNLTIAKSGNDWIVTPSDTSKDDVTYSFTVNAINT
jgi:hypothetical protein